MEFNDRFKAAMQLSYDTCKALKASGVVIPDADMKILLEYEQLKLIKLTMPKIKLAPELYYPTIQHKYFRGITQDSWVKIILWATKSFNIRCNLTLASASSYRSSPHKYNFIEPVIVPKSDIGKLGYEEECELFNQYKEEIEND